MRLQPETMSEKISAVILCSVLALPTLGFAEVIDIQVGATINLGGGTIDAGCTDAKIAGIYNLQDGLVTGVRDFTIYGTGVVDASATGTIRLSGDWNNAGTFTAGNSMVFIEDGCSTTISRMTGNTDFYEFSTQSAISKELQPAAGSIQTFSNKLTLRGVDNATRLPIRSDTDNSPAYFCLDTLGSQDIYAVDVKDNNADGANCQTLVPMLPQAADSLDGGNTPNWFVADQPPGGGTATPVPTLPLWTLLFLIIAIMTAEFWRRRTFLN